MMKTFLLLIFMVLSAGPPPDSTRTVEGYLQLFGTDQFPQLAVVTEKYGRLFVDMDPARQDSLWRERRGTIRITGRIHEGWWRGNPHLYIKPEKWRWIHADP